jgi:SAM-dependent methyltransferase
MELNATKEVELYYERINKKYESIYSNYIGSIENDFREIQGLFSGDWPKGKALDLGCGSGALTELLLGAQEEIVALDISRVMLEKMEERVRTHPLREKVRIMHGDAVALPQDLRNSQFEIVLFWGNGISHVPCTDYSLLASSISHALSPEGYFVLNYRDGVEWGKMAGKLELVGTDSNIWYYFYIFDPLEIARPCDRFSASIIAMTLGEDNTPFAEIINPCVHGYFCDIKALAGHLKTHGIVLQQTHSGRGLAGLHTAIFRKLK